MVRKLKVLETTIIFSMPAAVAMSVIAGCSLAGGIVDGYGVSDYREGWPDEGSVQDLVPIEAPSADEELECTPCSVDQDCADALFCNGREFCDTASGCCSFEPACGTTEDPCRMLMCIEEMQACVDSPLDNDGDGYTVVSVEGPSGQEISCGGSDCDDGNGGIHPGAPDGCGDMLDNDCDFLADEDAWHASGSFVPLSGEVAGVTDADILSVGEQWVVAWSESTGGASSLRAGVYGAATEGPDAPPSDLLEGSTGAGEVEIAAAAGAGAVVIWIEEGQRVKGKLLSLADGIQQQPAVTLWSDPVVPSDMSDLEVAADPGGSHAGIFFRSSRDGNFEIYMLVADLGNFGPDGVTGPVRVSRFAGFSGYPSAAARGDGYIVAWEDRRDGNGEIYYRKIRATAPPEEPEMRATTGPGNSRYPFVSGSAEGYFILWMEESGGPFNILAAKLDESAVPVGVPAVMDAGDGARSYPCASPDPRGGDFSRQHLIVYTFDDGQGSRLFITGIGERSITLQPGLELYSTTKEILWPVLSEGLLSRAVIWIEWDYSGGRLHLLKLECM